MSHVTLVYVTWHWSALVHDTQIKTAYFFVSSPSQHKKMLLLAQTGKGSQSVANNRTSEAPPHGQRFVSAW